MSEADPSPAEIQPIDYAARWSAIVERRRAQMDAASARAGIANVDYWGRRAKQYRESLHSRMDEDPFLARVAASVSGDTTVLDVGAGTGRHALALAPRAAHVTAIDPSEAMLGLLRRDLDARGITNVETLLSAWLDAEVEPTDVVICSHVVYPIADIVPFVRKLDASARDRVFVYVRVDPMPTDFGLWREFYGEPLQQQPVHHDLLNVLAQIGIAADVEVVRHAFTWTFASLDEAVEQVRNSLCLSGEDNDATAKLRRLLDRLLLQRPDRRLGPEIGSARSAIISWSPATDSRSAAAG